jgi:hypothetical protein
MKIKTFILTFIAIFFASCEDIESVKHVEQTHYELDLPNQGVIITEYTIDGCQYIGHLGGDPSSNYLSHKGNCTNPIHNKE